MKGNKKVIDVLSVVLKNELTAINQYFIHYKMAKHWGYDKLARIAYQESIDEMKHADEVMDKTGKLGVPYLIIDGEWVRGYELHKPFSEAFARSLFEDQT